MTDHEIKKSSSTEGLPVSPALGPSLDVAGVQRHLRLIDRRVVFISILCALLGAVAAGIAFTLTSLIGFITNLAFYGRLSTEFISPANNQLGAWVIGVPVIGGIIVGFMARYGSKAIRGHGIPEAMEQILINDSRIPARMTILKPLSAAIAIGTGGPFGAEGPIIATGGALGSLLGQLIPTSSSERKTLLAAGAAAGMTATFGSPIAAILLAIELLLFEFKPRSIIPVTMAAVIAASLRMTFIGSSPSFPMLEVLQPSLLALFSYSIEGVVLGFAAVLITKSIYWIEDLFEKLPIHWMWWPALGAVAVGVVGYFSPHTLGVGYENIEDILNGKLLGTAMIFFCIMKFISWSISLGSGTSGGTLAPIFTIGGGIGAAFGSFIFKLFPMAQIDVRVAALVGMAATFAGASRALLASIIFAFETTRQIEAILPLLCSCSIAYLTSALLMRNTIMTEKLVRRGHHVPAEYVAAHYPAHKG